MSDTKSDVIPRSPGLPLRGIGPATALHVRLGPSPVFDRASIPEIGYKSPFSTEIEPSDDTQCRLFKRTRHNHNGGATEVLSKPSATFPNRLFHLPQVASPPFTMIRVSAAVLSLGFPIPRGFPTVVANLPTTCAHSHSYHSIMGEGLLTVRSLPRGATSDTDSSPSLSGGF